LLSTYDKIIGDKTVTWEDPYIKYWLEYPKEMPHLGHKHHDDDDNIKMDVNTHELRISELI